MKKCVLKKCRKPDRDYIKGIVEEVVKEELDKRENKTSCDESSNMTTLQTCIVNALLEADRERDRLEKEAYDKAGKTCKYKILLILAVLCVSLCVIAIPLFFIFSTVQSGFLMALISLFVFIIWYHALLLYRLSNQNIKISLIAILVSVSAFIFQIADWVK